MLIKEYRIPIPLTLEEYRIAQLYMIQKKSREESEGEDSGVEILENKPYTEGPFGGGQYTYKVYHIGRHIPSWFRSVVPKTALEVHEESWNAYPYTKTKFSVPFVEKFLLEVDTVFRADAGTQENIFNLKPSELRERELDVIDIVNDSLSGSDYEEEEDPSLYQSLKTGRGPLTRDWIQNPPDGVIMCSYKLIKVGFRYWGLQSRVERFIHDYGLRRVMLRAHRQAWAWQDEWVGLTMDDIRKLELETKLILQSKLGRPMEEEERTDGDIQGGEDTMNEDLPKNDTRVSERVGSYRSRRRLSSRQHTSSIRSTGGGGTTSPPSELQIPKEKIDSDEEGSLYSYYALESIAIHEDSDTDTEYFDAKEIISEVDIEDSDQEFVDPEVGSHLSDFPHSLEENLDDLSADAEHCLYISISPLCSQDVLFLVVHSGTGFQFDDVNDKIDSQTLSGIFDEVFRTHYQFTIGRITIRFVPCPDISSSAYNLVSSLRPSPVALATQTFTPPYKNQFYDHTFPICTLPLIATEDPTYHNSLDQLVSSANSVYQTFLVSEEGRYFKGQVCLLADCIGSVMVYDILTRNTSDTFRSPSHSPAQSPSTTPTIMKRLGHKPISMSVPNDYQVHQSLGTPTRDAPRVLRIPSPTQEKRLPRFTRRSDAPLLFDVSKVFVFGSPLGLVLSLRRTRDGKMTTIRPQCESFYNLFYSADPLAFRLEPLLDPLFSSIPPLLIPSYHLYPTGDKSSSRLFETVSNYRHYFDSAHQLHPATLSNTKPNRGRRYASMECLIVGQYSEEEEDVRRKDTPPQGLRPFCVWWGDQRIDYQLQAPSGLEHGETLPVSNTAYAHIAQARYWEAKEMVSFVLRQVLQGGEGVPVLARSAGKQGFWVPFVPPTSTVKWAKKKTPLRIQKMSPNHRAVDIVVSTHSTHLPNLQAKFFYGPLNMAALSGEMVSIYILTSSDNKNEYNAGELKGATSAIDPVSMATETSPPKRSWHYLDTVSTDKHGRLNYNLSVEQCPFHPGLYPLIYLVKGDHTITCSNLFVLPPHTEAVVFSIDGALSSNFSLSGRDMKLKEDSIGITRLWQDLGYLIIYISGRPNMQKEYVTSWLGYHGFPLGVVSFADTLSTDSQNTKLLYLARLIKEAKVILSIAYGSQRHLTLYKELGLQPNQIYLYTKHSVKKAAGKAKDNCQLLTEDSGHFSELTANPPRPAAVDVTKIIGKLYFGYSETTVTSNFSKTKARSSSSPKVP